MYQQIPDGKIQIHKILSGAWMPTLLFIHGWRFFFYANERNEPPHIHVQKGDTDGKYWLSVDEFDINEVYAYNMSPAQRRQVRKIIFEYFDYFVTEYQNIHGE
jgi:hypothetical protein